MFDALAESIPDRLLEKSNRSNLEGTKRRGAIRFFPQHLAKPLLIRFLPDRSAISKSIPLAHYVHRVAHLRL